MNSFSAKTLTLPILCSLALSACYHTYSADPITTTVVDAETKQPLEGVVVAAHWEMKGGMEGGNVGGEVKIMEAVTNAEGKFHFPAWGPETVYVGLSNSRLTNDTPEMILFKPGYKIDIAANPSSTKNFYGVGPHVSSAWNDKIIQLTKFDGPLDKYADHLDEFFPAYAFANHCGWQHIPKMLWAIRDQSLEFEKAGIRISNFYWDLKNNDGYGCGSVDDFLNEHEK